MKIKICGLTRICEAEYLNENDIDYAGFVFYEKSKRNIALSQALEIMDKLTGDIKRVAVMVSPTEEFIRQLNELPFEIILAGGLNKDNVREGIRRFAPDVVDVSSAVEGCDGKDRNKIKAFADAVREA